MTTPTNRKERRMKWTPATITAALNERGIRSQIVRDLAHKIDMPPATIRGHLDAIAGGHVAAASANAIAQHEMIRNHAIDSGLLAGQPLVAALAARWLDRQRRVEALIEAIGHVDDADVEQTMADILTRIGGGK